MSLEQRYSSYAKRTLLTSINMHLKSKSLTQEPRGFNEGYAAFDHISGTFKNKRHIVMNVTVIN